jgi:hypothetical protein
MTLAEEIEVEEKKSLSEWINTQVRRHFKNKFNEEQTTQLAKHFVFCITLISAKPDFRILQQQAADLKKRKLISTESMLQEIVLSLEKLFEHKAKANPNMKFFERMSFYNQTTESFFSSLQIPNL